MKELYEGLDLEVIRFGGEDVITASAEDTAEECADDASEACAEDGVCGEVNGDGYCIIVNDGGEWVENPS